MEQELRVWSILAGLLALVGIFIVCAMLLYARLRARAFGLNISNTEAAYLIKHYAGAEEFLTGVKQVWQLKHVPLEKLLGHYRVKGNFKNLISGMQEMKNRNREIDIDILITMDFAGKDLKVEVEKASRQNWEFRLY